MKSLLAIRTVKSLLLAGAVAAGSHAAQASTILMYNLTNVTTSAGTLTGTLSINSANDFVTAANITFNDAAVGNPVFNTINSANAYNGLSQDYIVVGTSNPPTNYGGQIALYFNTANVATDGTLNICLATGPCGTSSNQASTVQVYVSTNNGGPFNITGGTLTAAPATAPTPEPSSLLLLGTGLCGIAGMARRKFLA